MEKTIVIDGQQVAFKSSGAIPKRYKMQFQRDFFKDLLAMGLANTKLEKLTEEEQLEAFRKIDFEVFYDIAWTLAKTANPTIPDPMAWLDGFEAFPIMDILPELQDMLSATISTTKKN